MRLITKVAFVLCLLVTLILVGTQTQIEASANAIQQDTARFDGVEIYFSESNGEASRYDRFDNGISRLAGLLRQLGASLHSLDWRSRFPLNADLVIIAGPVTDITADQTARLWSYVTNGGRLLFLANPTVETTGGSALPVTGGLFQLLWNDMGLRGRNDVVVMETTNSSASTEVTEEVDSAQSTGLIANFITANITETHPITADLEGDLAFFISRSIEYDASIRDVNTTALVSAASDFYGESAYTTYLQTGAFQYDSALDTGRGPLALAVAFEDPLIGTRIVLIGDRQFVTNGAGFQTSPPGSASFVNPANVRFTLNAITWLLDKENVTLSLPTPGPTSTPSLTPSPTLSPTPTPLVTPTATPNS